MNAHTTSFLSRSCNDLAKRTLNSSVSTGSSMKACKNEQFHVLFSTLSLGRLRPPYATVHSSATALSKCHGLIRGFLSPHRLLGWTRYSSQPSSTSTKTHHQPAPS